MLEKLKYKYDKVSDLKLKLKKDLIRNLKLKLISWEISKDWSKLRWENIKIFIERYKCINIYLRKRLEQIEYKIAESLFKEDLEAIDISKEEELIY